MLEELTSYTLVHSNSLIKNFTPFEDDVVYLQTTRRWLHPKLISTLKFLSNCKTMFLVISQEQHSIKTLEFTETNSYFYSFTYGKNIFSSSSLVRSTGIPVDWFFVNLLADRKVVGLTPKYSLADGDTNKPSIFSACIRWINMIDWSTKLSLTRQSLI